MRRDPEELIALLDLALLRATQTLLAGAQGLIRPATLEIRRGQRERGKRTDGHE